MALTPTQTSVIIPSWDDIQKFGRPEGGTDMDRMWSIMVAKTDTPEGRAIMRCVLGIEPKSHK